MPANSLALEATDADAAAWNAYLDATPGTSPLARYEWRQVLEKSYGVRTYFLVAKRDDAVVGVLGAYVVTDLFGARHLYSLRGALHAADAAAGAALLSKVEDDRQRENWSTLLTTGGAPLPGQTPDLIRKTVQLEIAADSEAMWRGLKDKTRNMIRRAEKEGVEIVSGAAHVDALVDHYQSNMLRLGIRIHSRAFFHQIVDRLGPAAEVLVARYRQQPIASMLLLYGKDVGCFPFQNAAAEFRKLAPIQSLNWAAMKRCAERGITLLDMGESREGSSVFLSKTNFGGVPRDVAYYRCGSEVSAGSKPRTLSHMVRSAANLAEAWLANHGPRPLRTHFAEKRLLRGRLL